MKLSIITINRNNKEGLQRTMESVLGGQTFDDFEYIVIDGASDDGSKEVIEHYQDRLAYWCSERDRGIYHAMNKGIAQAKGDYLLFMNSGDCLVEGCLSKVFTQENDADFIYGNVIGCLHGNRLAYAPPHLSYKTLTFIQLYKSNISHQATFIRRRLFDNCPYTENYRIASDWEFFLKKIVLENCSTRYVDELICEFDVTGISSNPKYKAIHGKERTEVLKRYIPQRILDDYVNFALLDDIREDKLLSAVLDIKATRTFKRFLIKVDLFLYRFYCLLRKRRT